LRLLPLTSCSRRDASTSTLGGELAWPACSPPAGRIGRPSCGGAGRSVTCSGPGISAAL